jgi:hypothetical protein
MSPVVHLEPIDQGMPPSSDYNLLRSCRNASRLLFHEGQQVRTPEAPLSPATDAQARQLTRVGPPTQRRLADVQETGGLLDGQQFLGFAHRTVAQEVT